MSSPQHNHVGEPLFCYDDVTSCGDVSLRAVFLVIEKYAINVRNTIFYQMLIIK